MKKQLKLLVSIDESKQSAEILRFITENHCFHAMDITLFHVAANLPLFLQDSEGAFSALLHQEELERIRELKEQKFLKFIEKGRKKLLKAGMDEKHIHTKVAEKVVGVARDILSEAASGYDMIMIGRRGMGKLKGIFLGSVSTKILEKAAFTPVIVLGSCQPLKKIYIAFDGSDCSMKAVRFVGDVMGNNGYLITLIRVLRMEDFGNPAQAEALIYTQNWYDKVEKNMRAQMEIAKTYLVESGIPPKNINFIIIKDAESRAGAIVKEVDYGGPGIIVMGRRGLSRVEEFVMGRVSNKVMQLAKTSTICIIPEQYTGIFDVFPRK
ncbi:universal stress protein [bacterium]|nr:universal stress protein [bacterium]